MARGRDRYMPSIVKRHLLGRAMNSRALDETLLPKRLALPVFCSDPLSSVAYATQEILLVLALGGAALASLLPGLSTASGLGRRPALAAAGVVAVALALGGWSDATAPPPSAGSLRVGLVQGNIDQGVKWSPGFAEDTLKAYEDLHACEKNHQSKRFYIYLFH